MGDLRQIRPQNDSPNGLTGIHPRIHCTATNGQEDLKSDADRIIVHHFLSTLAEIALAIAHRRADRRNRDDDKL